MVRVVKEHSVRRNEILDAAQRLVYTKGYEQMTIQDILDDLQISKGAFYHYFDSKQALLEALIERMGEEVEQLLIPIVRDPHLPVLEKLRRFFPALSGWKTARKTFFLSLLRVWYDDDNAIVRQKARALAVKRISPLLTEIICQGIQEGILTTAYPDKVGEVVAFLVLDLSDTVAGLILSWEPGQDVYLRVERTVAAYTDTLERALGAPTGSLPLIDAETLAETLKEWFVSPGDNT